MLVKHTKLKTQEQDLECISVDLNIGGGSRIIRLSEEQASAMFIPELDHFGKSHL